MSFVDGTFGDRNHYFDCPDVADIRTAYPDPLPFTTERTRRISMEFLLFSRNGISVGVGKSAT